MSATSHTSDFAKIVRRKSTDVSLLMFTSCIPRTGAASYVKNLVKLGVRNQQRRLTPWPSPFFGCVSHSLGEKVVS